MKEEFPVQPINNFVLARLLPYRPSKIMEVVNFDNAFMNEAIIVKLPKKRLAKKLIRDNRGRVVGHEFTGIELPIELNVGDRVIIEATYQMEDTQKLNGETYRWLDYDKDIKGIVHADQPELENPITGEKLKNDSILQHI